MGERNTGLSLALCLGIVLIIGSISLSVIILGKKLNILSEKLQQNLTHFASLKITKQAELKHFE